jgi:hypothetical protein
LSGPFHSGLFVVFSVSAAISVLAGLASLLRGKHRVPVAEEPLLATTEEAAAAAGDAEEAAAAVADPEDASEARRRGSP